MENRTAKSDAVTNLCSKEEGPYSLLPHLPGLAILCHTHPLHIYTALFCSSMLYTSLHLVTPPASSLHSGLHTHLHLHPRRRSSIRHQHDPTTQHFSIIMNGILSLGEIVGLVCVAALVCGLCCFAIHLCVERRSDAREAFVPRVMGSDG